MLDKFINVLNHHALLKFKHSCITCDGGSHSHGHGHQAQQEADSLGHVICPNELKGNGGHDADEAAVEQPHQQAYGDQPAKDVAQRNHHGHEADNEEGSYLEGQQRGEYLHENSSFDGLIIFM